MLSDPRELLVQLAPSTHARAHIHNSIFIMNLLRLLTPL
eukprot:COSAG06_NODE_39110_length_416_cov_0.902208_2_plen_38_part_01